MAAAPSDLSPPPPPPPSALARGWNTLRRWLAPKPPTGEFPRAAFDLVRMDRREAPTETITGTAVPLLAAGGLTVGAMLLAQMAQAQAQAAGVAVGEGGSGPVAVPPGEGGPVVVGDGDPGGAAGGGMAGDEAAGGPAEDDGGGGAGGDWGEAGDGAGDPAGGGGEWLGAPMPFDLRSPDSAGGDGGWPVGGTTTVLPADNPPLVSSPAPFNLPLSAAGQAGVTGAGLGGADGDDQGETPADGSSAGGSESIGPSDGGGAGQSLAGGGEGGAGGQSAPPGDGAGARRQYDTASLPVRFVANAGQWADGVDFAVRGDGYQVALSAGSATAALARPATGEEARQFGSAVVYDAVRLDWVGADPAVRGEGEGRLDSVSNYLLGADPAAWHTDVAEYAGVRYRGAWAGVDLVYRRADGRRVEYDLAVRPGASADAVGFTVRGAAVRVDELGRLVLTTPAGGELVQSAPVAYQTTADGRKEGVTAAYRLRDDGSVGFAVGGYDAGRELVIDPVLVYGTTLGGSATDAAYGVAADADGNAYAVGSTQSSNFPASGGYDATLGGLQDGFVTKLGPTGAVVWSTYLGGTGYNLEEARGVALGPDGSVYVTGTTYTNDFPTTAGAYQTTANGNPMYGSYQEAFLTKLAPTGNALTYSTYLGGYGGEAGYGVGVDAGSGEAVVAGYTTQPMSGTDFPTLNAAQPTRSGSRDAFVTRFNDAGSALVFSTYLGGSAATLEQAYGVAVDAAGDAYVGGVTDSSNFPLPGGYDVTLGGSSDAFLARYSPAGQLTAATLFGGGGAETGYGVAVDRLDRPLLVGSTASSDLPTRNPVQGSLGGSQDGFVARFTGLGEAPDFATYQGGVGADVAYGVAADPKHRAVVAGTDGTKLTATRYTAPGTAVQASRTWGTVATGYAAAAGGGRMFAAGSTSSGGGTDAVVAAWGAPLAPSITSVTDDTGVSASDKLTKDTALIVSGTSEPSVEVVVTRTPVGAGAPADVGTVTADGAGAWSLGPLSAVAEGKYTFTARAVDLGLSSDPSDGYLVTVDTTAPTLTVEEPEDDGALFPHLLVTGSDLNGLATTVALDIDRNDDGDFLDPDEADAATATWANGAAVLTPTVALPLNQVVGLRARAEDAAGNAGTSDVLDWQVVRKYATLSDNTPNLRYDAEDPNALLHAGILRAEHPLDLDVSPASCGCQNPALVYDSSTASPVPTVQVKFQPDNSLAALPTSITATYTWDGAVVAGGVSLSLTGLVAGSPWVFAFQPSSAQATGRHTYTVDLFVDYPGTVNDVSAQIAPNAGAGNGFTFVVDNTASPFGAGWAFSNTDRLYDVAADGSLPAGKLRAYGHGGWGFHPASGGGYGNPPGDEGTLAAAGGGWEYTGVKQRKLTFDSAGRMTRWSNPDGSELFTYTYDGGGRLATMTGPDGGLATFAYDGGGKIQTIAAANALRTYTFALSGGALTGITDPAGGTRSFTASGGKLTGDQYGYGTLTAGYAYGMVDWVKWGADANTEVDPQLSRGLAAPFDGDAWGGRTDPLSALNRWTFDRGGNPLVWLPPDGRKTTWARNADRQTTGITRPLQRTTGYSYTADGLVYVETFPDGSTRVYTYHATWRTLATFTDELGRVTTYTYSATSGRLTSVATPDGGVTTYTWSAAGLLDAVTDPLARTTTHLYDAARRYTHSVRPDGTLTGTVVYDGRGEVAAVVDPLGNRATSVYDATGRLTQTTNAAGETSTYAYDAAGRLTGETAPTGRAVAYTFDGSGSGRITSVTEAPGNALQRTTQRVYDAAGRMTVSIDPLGYRTTYAYDANGRVVTTQNPLGAVWRTVYDDAGRVTVSIDPLGRATRYAYDLRDRRTAVTDPAGHRTTTAYDLVGNVTATTDPTGAVWATAYDRMDRATASVDPLGHRTTTTYDLGGQWSNTADPLGYLTAGLYDTNGRLVAVQNTHGNRATTAYDLADRATATVDELGRVTTYTYDGPGRVTGTLDPLGGRTTAVYDSGGRYAATVDPLGRRTTVVYDALDRAAATVDALGGRTTTVYDARDAVLAVADPLNRRTTFAYDAAGRRTYTLAPHGAVWKTAYDAAGQPTRTTDPLGGYWYTGFDAAGRAVTATDPLGNTSATAYDPVGRPTRSTDPLGNATTTAYDAAGRATETTDALGRRTTYSYDPVSQLTRVTDALGRQSVVAYDALGRPERWTDALGRVTTAAYDAVGNRTLVIDPLGRRATVSYDALDRPTVSVDPLAGRTTVAYDAAGNATLVTDPLARTTTVAYDALHRATETLDPLGRRATTVYDLAGQQVASIDPLGRRTTVAYDLGGRAVAVVDALNRRHTSSYDLLGRLVTTRDPAGYGPKTFYDEAGRVEGTADARSFYTTYALDAAGNATAATDPLGNATAFAYDALNRATRTTDALGGVSTVAFDAVGNPTLSIDPLGRRTTHSYDNLDRNVETVDALGHSGVVEYDAVGNVTASIDQLNRRTTYAYDALDRATKVTDALGNVGTAAYDAAGQTTVAIDPLGRRTTYAYDAAGRVTATRDPLNALWTVAYDAADNATASTDPLARITTVSYDALDRATEWRDPLGNRTTAVYDTAGNRAAVVNPLGRRTTTAYDADHRPTVTTDALNNRTTVAYDAAGNATVSTDPLGRRTTTVYDALSRGVASVDPLGNRSTVAYDAAGNATTSTDPLGRVGTVAYDALNRATQWQDALGNRSTVAFDAVGNATLSIDPLGFRTTHAYDALDRATGTTDALNNLWATSYDAAGNATVSVDPLGRRTTTAYDALDRATQVTDALGGLSTVAFDAAGQQTVSVDQLGRRTTYAYDAAGRVTESRDPLGNRTTSVYDAAGNATVSVDPLARRTTVSYDALDRTTEVRDALGNRSTVVFDAAGNATVSIDQLGRRTTMAYDAADRMTESRDPLGNRSTVMYDAAGNATASLDPLNRRSTVLYDALDRATSWLDPLSNRSTVAFDAAGQATVSIDPLGNRTTTAYDAVGRATGTTDALNNLWATNYDAAGNATVSVTPLGFRTTVAFDALDRATTVTDPLGSRTTSVYDAAGQLTASVNARGFTATYAYDAAGRVTSSIDPLGFRTTSSYDAAGNRTETLDARGNRTTVSYDALDRTTEVRDALGNRTTVVYDAAGQRVATVNPRGYRTTVSYDAAGRATETLDALSRRATTAYDAAGQATVAVDPLGLRTTLGYDLAGRQTTALDPRGYTTTTAYDAAGNVRTVTDAAANVTTFAYDPLHRVTATTDPLGATGTVAFDADGRTTGATDRLGRRRAYGYDAAGRVLTDTWVAVGGATVEVHTFAYDAAGNQTLASAPVGAYTLAYDARDMVTAVQQPFGVAQTFTYDQVGNRTGVADSFGGLTTAAYDAADRLTLREMGGTGVTRVRVTFAYDAASNQTGETRQSWNGSAWVSVGTTTQAFDAADRVTGIRHATGAGTQLWLGTYAYDAGDRMTGKWENTTPTTYQYDNTDQLIKDGANATLTYDGTGNRTNAGYATTGGNRMTNDGVWTYTYDAAGQVTKRSQGAAAETWVYAYDHAGRLLTASKSATDGGAATDVLTYTLDAWGNRLQRQQSGTSSGTERYAVDGWDTALPGPRGTENFQAAFDLTSGNALSVRRVFGSGFDTPEGRQDGSGNVRWYLADHQGSVVRLSDNSGVPTATVSYDAFGKVLSSSGDFDRYGWSGTAADSLTGLVGDDARAYDPTTGRWLSEDPIGFAGGDVNLFRAVGNRATTLRDPSGLHPVFPQPPLPPSHTPWREQKVENERYELSEDGKYFSASADITYTNGTDSIKVGARTERRPTDRLPPAVRATILGQTQNTLGEVAAQVKVLREAKIDPKVAVDAVRQLRRDYYLALLNKRRADAGQPPIASVADIDEKANVREWGIEAAILVMLKRKGKEGYQLLRKADRAEVEIELDTSDLSRIGLPWHAYKYEWDPAEGVTSAKNRIVVYATKSDGQSVLHQDPTSILFNIIGRACDEASGKTLGEKFQGAVTGTHERTVGEAADSVYDALKGMSGQDPFNKILNNVGGLFTHDTEEGLKAAADIDPSFKADYEAYQEVVEEWEAGKAFASAYVVQYYQRQAEDEAIGLATGHLGELAGHLSELGRITKASKEARKGSKIVDAGKLGKQGEEFEKVAKLVKLRALMRGNGSPVGGAPGARYTGARTIHTVADAQAEATYTWIRGLDAETNIATVARNTGMPEHVIRSVRQHVFFDEHVLMDSGKLVRRRFSADDGIATWWKAATEGGLPKAELERFQKLIAHEYIEHGLMKYSFGPDFPALPYRVYGKDGNPIVSSGSAHDLAPRAPDNMSPGTPIYDPGRGPWTNWDKLFPPPKKP